MGVLLCLDYYAIRARAADKLLQFLDAGMDVRG